MSDPVLARLKADREGILSHLYTFVRHPSVGADPAYADGMRGAQDFLLDRLQALGLRKVQRLEAGGQPAIYGEWLGAPGKPTFLIYGHYDVQPPDPFEKWSSPPFEPTLRNERIYARGVSDDKAPSHIALEVLGAFLQEEGSLPVNVKVLLEGEEETGSATLGALCRRYADLLVADAVISADGARWRPDRVHRHDGQQGSSLWSLWRSGSECTSCHRGVDRIVQNSRWRHRRGGLLQ
jgi:acetylornithine deacetylase/succinyl-diaminopimelate desuccinylase-like protein